MTARTVNLERLQRGRGVAPSVGGKPLPVVPVHTAVRGRARFRVAGLYRAHQAVATAIEEALRSRSGILGVSANVLTGTVLVRFHCALEPGRVTDWLAAIVNPLPAGRASASVLRLPAVGGGRKAPAPDTAVRAVSDRAARPWHLLDTGEALSFFDSASGGLSEACAAARLRRDGPNRLARPPRRSGLGIFVDQFKSLPVALLAVSAVLSAATGGLADAGVIMAVVLVNAAIGFVTESRSEQTISALTVVPPHAVPVLRDGQPGSIAPEQVVVGDVLLLAPGTRVAADARLLQDKDLAVDESALTGESLPATKSARRLSAQQVPLADRINMIYMGTVVTGGSGLALVVATGGATEIGAIQALVGATRPPETPMQRQLGKLGKQTVLLSGAICGVVFVLGLLRGYGLLQMLKAAVSLAVAAVPEGLPTVATTTLALGIRDMRRHKVLVRQLGAVETLGAVQVICLDKTGTLTLNQMSVLMLFAGMARIKLSAGRFQGASGDIDVFGNDELLRLIHVATLCNEADLGTGKGGFVIKGSATESALLQMAVAAGIGVEPLRRRYPRARVEYRAEGRNYMRTWHRSGNGLLLAVKGSPEQVLALCRWFVKDGMRRELTAQDRETILSENEKMAGEALRVLGFAYAHDEQAEEEGGESLTWLGLAGMADPLRRGVKELIRLFHGAGIGTVMITGDQSATAYAIGKELELSGNRHLEILDSSHLEQVDPTVMAALAQKAEIFSRVSPAHKLQIVQALQHAGKVVAMTGDGINDGPALKAADIGVAMGGGGTDVARGVADVVLEDDNLQTMIVAVSEGRTIYNNIRKSVHFLVSTNLSEIAVMLASIGAGMGQPLNTMQLLWVNLLTDVFPALALAVEPPEPDILRRPPRDPQEPIIKPADFKRYGWESLAITAGAMASYGYGVMRYGVGPQAGTMAFMSLTTAQLLHAQSCRSESHSIFGRERLPPNPYLKFALGGSLAAQLSAVLIPGLRRLLGTTPLNPGDVLAVAAGATLPFLVNEASKNGGSRAAARDGAPTGDATS